MQEMSSDEARRSFRRLLSDTENGQLTTINRYSEPVAVVVPVEWFLFASVLIERREAKLREEGWAMGDPSADFLWDWMSDYMEMPCRACEEMKGLRALCPDYYCPDCCDAADHNHPETGQNDPE
jgi:hypothetical protein